MKKIIGIQNSWLEIPFILFAHKIKSICPEIWKMKKAEFQVYANAIPHSPHPIPPHPHFYQP